MVRNTAHFLKLYDKVEWPLNVLQKRFCYLFFSWVFIKNKAKTIQEVNLQRLTQKYRKKYGKVGKDSTWKDWERW